MRRLITIFGVLAIVACGDRPASPSAPAPAATPTVATPEPAPAEHNAAFAAAVAERVEDRKAMLETQLVRRGISDPRVLEVMARMPRHEFVPEGLREAAYEDRPLPLGWESTISQPYIVALMTELADIQPGDNVLDVGTGSGYQAAVLADLGAKVWAIEIVPQLVELAGPRLQRLGFAVDLVQGDGWKGRPEHAPYDAILVAAAPPTIPQALIDQLADGGTLVIPTGIGWAQLLRVITKRGDHIEDRKVAPVAFVPLVHGE